MSSMDDVSECLAKILSSGNLQASAEIVDSDSTNTTTSSSNTNDNVLASKNALATTSTSKNGLASRNSGATVFKLLTVSVL
jgi:hypothetical protein